MSLFSNIQDKLGKKSAPQVDESELVLNALRAVQDPDLHRDIVSLGFVKDVRIQGKNVSLNIELTTPACPVKELIKSQSEQAIRGLNLFDKIEIQLSAQTRGSKITAPNIQASLGGVKNIIAVASGKGGVGKSTTTVNLAYALAKSGSKVGILDADVYGPSVPLMTGVGSPTEQIRDMVVPPTVDGVKIISVAMFSSAKSASILRGPMAGQIVKQFLSQVAWGDLDYLIIDYPPGTGDIQLTLSQVAPITAAVIVTTPQEVALIDVRKAVSMFETLKVPVLGVVETMSYFICDGCDKKHYIFRKGGGSKLATEFGLPVLGEIPIDTKIPEGSDAGKPLVLSHATSSASSAYQETAGALARQLSILHAASDGGLDQFSLTWEARH